MTTITTRLERIVVDPHPDKYGLGSIFWLQMRVTI